MARRKLRVVQSPKKKKKLVRLPSSPIHLPPKNYSFFHSKYPRGPTHYKYNASFTHGNSNKINLKKKSLVLRWREG
jgi:hypothetical protein